MLCYILYRLDTNTNGNIQCVRSLLLKPPLRPLLLSIPHATWTLPRPCMRPHARANALLQSDDEESVQEVVGAVSELHEDADDDGIIFDAPVRGSE